MTIPSIKRRPEHGAYNWIAVDPSGTRAAYIHRPVARKRWFFCRMWTNADRYNGEPVLILSPAKRKVTRWTKILRRILPPVRGR